MTGLDENGSAEERRVAVAEYVLGLLGLAEHARVGRLIENDPRWADEHRFWSGHFAALDDQVAPVPVPAHIRQRLEARLFGQERSGLAARLWDNLALWRGLAGGSLAVAIAALGFNLLAPRPDAAALTTQLVAALVEEGSPVQFVAFYDGQGNVRLTGLQGDAVPGHDYELWAIQGDDAPVSLGVVPVAGRSAVAIDPAVQRGWGEGSVLAVTLEQAGGSPDGNPHGPIVAKGAVTPI